MTAITLDFVRHNADGSTEMGTITVDPDDPGNPKGRGHPAPEPSVQDQVTSLTNALVAQGALPLQTAQSLGIAAVTSTVTASPVV